MGITEGAVRSRIKRGTLPTTKERGTVFVLLGDGTSGAYQVANPNSSPRCRTRFDTFGSNWTPSGKPELRSVGGTIPSWPSSQARYPP